MERRAASQLALRHGMCVIVCECDRPKELTRTTELEVFSPWLLMLILLLQWPAMAAEDRNWVTVGRRETATGGVFDMG
jgi:hypothetical protein